ncbi:hypothetical protein [Chryseobacterium sp. 2R14A]|uniref:hypothetical protein n=1 Tax=Chryseobacterium sp. 2R14A TaxID=3380353 RepID=UPI003CF1AF28
MKKIIRILISPSIFLYAYIELFAFTFFPLPILILMSLSGIILTPVCYVFKKIGIQLSTEEYEWINPSENLLLNHFLGFTVYIWYPFFKAYHFIDKAEIWNPSDK